MTRPKLRTKQSCGCGCQSPKTAAGIEWAGGGWFPTQLSFARLLVMFHLLEVLKEENFVLRECKRIKTQFWKHLWFPMMCALRPLWRQQRVHKHVGALDNHDELLAGGAGAHGSLTCPSLSHFVMIISPNAEQPCRSLWCEPLRLFCWESGKLTGAGPK